MQTHKMQRHTTTTTTTTTTKRGGGIINTLINKLPVELHLPSYQFCGPGTKLERRLQRGDKGINGLDSACRTHDIAYSQHKDIESRHRADKVLENSAWERFKSKDATFGEKASALVVTNAMKLKRKLGMGAVEIGSSSTSSSSSCLKKQRLQQRRRRLRRRRSSRKTKLPTFSFRNALVAPTREIIKEGGGAYTTESKKIKQALLAARQLMRKTGGKKRIRVPRIIPIPKTGGILPLIPLFAGLSALGALGGGAAGVAKAINAAKAAKNELSENIRHNKTMEAIALGGAATAAGRAKSGNGLFLGPYRKGMGLFLGSPKTKKHQRRRRRLQ